MQPKATSSDSFPWISVCTVLTGLVASGLLIIPLTSSRPVASPSEGDNGMSLQDVDARLWQDPLKPVLSLGHLEPGKTEEYEKKTHSLGQLRTEFFQTAKRPMLLAVMVNGSAYAEKVERRLRDRVAIVNALGRAGYSPLDAEHLGYFTVPWARSAGEGLRTGQTSQEFDTKFDRVGEPSSPGPECSKDVDCISLMVPFEQYEYDPIRHQEFGKDLPDRLLVLWLRQDYFSDKPLTRLAQLFARFQKPSTCSVAILGPDTSDSLLSIAKEVNFACNQSYDSQVSATLKGAKMYAFRPSASDAILLRGAHADGGCLKALIEGTCTGLKFYRTTISDDVLLRTTIDELRRRDIGFGKRWSSWLRFQGSKPSSDAVAIISEQDTFFGRAYPATFRTLNDSLSFIRPDSLDLLSYLRGIDGRTPNRRSDSSASSTSKTSSQTSKNAQDQSKQNNPREIPEGTDQSDYIRRLATQISVLDQVRGLQATEKQGISAIGVLGSDVYDKLEILHALQSRVRARLFFTVGLDARFYHPDELRATHNLLVVSPFGLRLHRSYQGSVLPFRDYNQTAAFASALCALGILQPDQIEDSKPRIFEISTQGPIDLSTDATSDTDEIKATNSLVNSAPGIHPGRPDLREIDWFVVLCHAAALVILVMSLTFAVHCIWGTRPTDNFLHLSKPTSFLMSATILAVLMGILMWIYYAQRRDGEPFNFFVGASMWPTEIIRLLVFLLAIQFVLEATSLLRRNLMDDVSKTFGLPPMIKRRLRWRAFLRTAKPWKHEANPDIDITKLWRQYLIRNSRVCRFGWTLIWSLVYGAVVGLLWIASRQPISPIRGEAIRNVDGWIQFLAMAASTFLTLFVVYATALDARFARLLGKGTTNWPAPVRNEHRLDSKEDSNWQAFNGDYLDLLLIAKRTRVVTRLIYFPFFTIALLILCRLPQFDNFDWPPILIAIFAFNIVLSSACVWVLRRMAEEARTASISNLRRELQSARATGRRNMRKAIQKTLREIESLDTGIFARVSRQPIVGALLLPSGSAAIWGIMQYVL